MQPSEEHLHSLRNVAGLRYVWMKICFLFCQLLFLSVVYATNAKSLTTKEGRREWESAFNTYYIQPVLENLDQVVTDAMDKIANDDTQGTDCDV